MPDPRWTGPPEQVALIFEAGNPASVIANSAAWVAETTNKEVAAGLSTAGAAATAMSWQGVGADASLVTNTGLNTGLHTLVGWTSHKIGVTQAAVQAFTVARSGVIPSLVSTTNREEWAVLNATNFLGVNTPAIVERDTEYFGEHWPHNSSVGWAYSGALTALTAALSAAPPPVAPLGASPAAPAEAGEAVAQAAGQSGMQGAAQVGSQAGQAAGSAGGAGDQLSSLMGQPMQMLQSMTEPLQQMFQAPMEAFQSFSSLPQGLMSSLGGMFSSGGGGAPGVTAAGAGAETALAGGGAAVGGGGGGVGGGAGGFPGAGLTSYTRPTSSFETEVGGRPTSLRAGVLNAEEVRGRTVSSAVGGTPMSMPSAGMLGRGGNSGGESDKDAVTRARVVVGGDPTDSR